MVSFSHFTVQEYLQGGDVNPSKFRLAQTTGHWYIMHCCLAYISCYDELYHDPHGHSKGQTEWAAKATPTKATPDSVSDSDSEFGFSDHEMADPKQADYSPFQLLLYAAKYWWQHAIAFCDNRAEPCLPDAVGRVADAIGGFQGQAFQSTVKVALAVADYHSSKGEFPDTYIWSRKPTDMVCIETKDPEHLQPASAVIGRLAKRLSKNGSWRPQEKYTFDFDSPLALHCAVGLGDGVTVRLLLDAGVNMNYQMGSAHRPMSKGKGYRDFAAYLTEKGGKSRQWLRWQGL